MARSGDEIGVSSAETLNQLLAGMSGDPSKLTELLLKNLLEKQNKQKQFNRLDDCPIKGKYSSLDAWLDEVQLWDDTNKKCDGNIANLSAKKYLKFMNSVKDSEDCDDLKKLAQVQFKENQAFDKKSENVIKNIIEKIKEKLDKSNLEKCSDAWLQFIDIKQDVNESAQSYVVRFEQVETQLRNVKITIPNRALAIHLLHRSS